MSLPEFQILRPSSLYEAVDQLAKLAPNVQIIAGGTDLVPSLRQGLFAPEYLLDIRGLHELSRISAQPAVGVAIGALATLRTIERSEVIRRQYSVLHEATRTVASPILRNMGTIGGNICLDTRCLWYNQSLAWRKSCGFCIKKDGDLCHVAPGGKKCWAVFSGDTAPALLCLDAELEIASARGFRRVPLRDFYTNMGDARMRLSKDELLTRVILPESSAGWRGAYRKLRVRGSIDYPLAGVAVTLKTGNHNENIVADARVAITGVNPAPVLVADAARVLVGKPVNEEAAESVGDMASRTARPLTTSALTPEYRREMIRVFTKRTLLECA